MKVEQLYTACLSEAAYYIESNGEAAIIDPLRESKPYVEKANAANATIKYIFETHFHADFVSGHLELSRRTGAMIVFGPTAQPSYPAHIAADGEEFKVGDARIRLIHTPGHTLESSCYLLIDEKGKERYLFTGDTLFIGDVGRPDLVQKVKADITPSYLAGLLYDSLHDKILPLPDDIVIYPGHGAGSACGKNLGPELQDTLAHQKKYNYALQPQLGRNEFIDTLLTGLKEPPQYFPSNVLMNLQGGVESVEQILKRGTTPLSPQEFRETRDELDALVLDTRSKELFPKAHIPGSIFIGLDDNFAPWVGALISPIDRPILLVTDKGREAEAVTRLSRVGYDFTFGYLDGGIDAWKQAGLAVDSFEEIDAVDFAAIYKAKPDTISLLDLRRENEFASQHINGAVNFPLDFIEDNEDKLDRKKTYYLHCAGGYRSVIAASILKSKGFDHIINIRGGFKALAQTSLSKSAYTIQTSYL